MADSLLIRACKRMNVERHPVWFMRQAGRYMPNYIALKNGKNILDIQKDPDASSSIAAYAAKELGVDAAILYSDITVPIAACGYPIKIEENIGPIAERTISDYSDLDAFSDFDCNSDAPYVVENVRLTKEKIGIEMPLIGFSAAPFTLASYIVEGRPSRSFVHSKAMMLSNPDLWHALMESLSKMIINYTKAQVNAGADAIQLFDSWAGYLSIEDYKEYVKPYTKKIFATLSDKVPKIHFCANSSALLEEFADTGCDVIGIDKDVPISEAFYRTKSALAIQGNLDPEIALSGGYAMEQAVSNILEESKSRNGFIFNLGHGVLKETNPENLKKIVRMVKESSA